MEYQNKNGSMESDPRPYGALSSRPNSKSRLTLTHTNPTMSNTTTATTTVDDGDPPPTTTLNHHVNPQHNGRKNTKNKKKRAPQDDVTSATSSTTSSNSHSQKLKGMGMGFKIPNFKMRLNSKNKLDYNYNCNCDNYNQQNAMAFPLGMSIAAVIAQVLESKDLTSNSTSVDYLTMICTSAVRESLTNVFGEKFDTFAMNFEKSFGSTLNTIRLVRSETSSGGNQVGNSNVSDRRPYEIPAISSTKGECSSRRDDDDASEYLKLNESTEDHVAPQSGNQELPVKGAASWQLAHLNPRYLSNHSVLSTIEKSVSEQTRANELKSMEIGLIMKKLQLKEAQLNLDSDSNFLERCKLSLGISRTSFKVEKFKTQLQEARYGELLLTCADYLVTGLIIMTCFLCCGIYTFSYDNLHQLTKSCYPPEGSKSWWKPMASFNLGWQTLSCQVQVYSRMIFGGVIIGGIAFSLARRSDIARQGMPITFVVLLLGILCGLVGKISVDTLGGNGYTWLIFWEVLCVVHFFAIIYNPLLYCFLYGAVQVCQGTKYRTLFPFWIRRLLFRLLLLLLPVCCGLLPFASASTWWKDHLSIWIRNRWLATYGETYDVGNYQ